MELAAVLTGIDAGTTLMTIGLIGLASSICALIWDAMTERDDGGNEQ